MSSFSTETTKKEKTKNSQRFNDGAKTGSTWLM